MEKKMCHYFILQLLYKHGKTFVCIVFSISFLTKMSASAPTMAVTTADDTIDQSLSKQCIAEGAGVFFLLLCVLVATEGQGWLIAAGLLVVITVFGPAASGGGHFNPVVTGVAYAKKDCDGKTAMCKIVSQVTGGLLAFAVWYAFYGVKKVAAPAPVIQAPQPATVPSGNNAFAF
jgi:glycerol uptake facilitator-like aquaporin